MTQDIGRSAEADGLSQAEPKVSALRASIPNASGIAAIGLVGIKNNLNMGGCLRAAHCFGASLIAIQGSRLQKQAADTTKAHRHIPSFVVDDILAATPYGCQRVVVEIRDDAVPLFDFCHPRQAFYIFGPEDGSVPSRIVDQCQHIVSIPTAYCLNLAATVNVVLYDRAQKRAMRPVAHRCAA
jgi:tRNA(Leu) C34 or U34 (ribose-2'-O)-methylase TrmL